MEFIVTLYISVIGLTLVWAAIGATLVTARFAGIIGNEYMGFGPIVGAVFALAYATILVCYLLGSPTAKLLRRRYATVGVTATLRQELTRSAILVLVG